MMPPHRWFFAPALLSLCLSTALARAKQPENRINTESMRQTHAPNDAEFWDVYDELADDQGHMPAPEEIPPLNDPLQPSREQNTPAALENL
jgi:hypothetical protein